MITAEKWNRLRREMAELGIDEDALEEHFIRGSGRGGQKMNKTSSCVQLIYGELEVRCQKTRSQAENRFWARRELCERILERREGAWHPPSRTQPATAGAPGAPAHPDLIHDGEPPFGDGRRTGTA